MLAERGAIGHRIRAGLTTWRACARFGRIRQLRPRCAIFHRAKHAFERDVAQCDALAGSPLAPMARMRHQETLDYLRLRASSEDTSPHQDDDATPPRGPGGRRHDLRHLRSTCQKQSMFGPLRSPPRALAPFLPADHRQCDPALQFAPATRPTRTPHTPETINYQYTHAHNDSRIVPRFSRTAHDNPPRTAHDPPHSPPTPIAHPPLPPPPMDPPPAPCAGVLTSHTQRTYTPPPRPRPSPSPLPTATPPTRESPRRASVLGPRRY
jgi:hypothetical protein